MLKRRQKKTNQQKMVKKFTNALVAQVFGKSGQIKGKLTRLNKEQFEELYFVIRDKLKLITREAS
jgi:hypothetical protein